MSKKPRKKQPARPVPGPTLEQLEARRVELVKMIERDVWNPRGDMFGLVDLVTIEQRELALLDLRIAAMKGKS